MKPNVIQINRGITMNANVECKKHYLCENDYLWRFVTYICENKNYLASNMNDSTIICDEIKKSHDKEIKTNPTNFNEKKVTCKMHFLIFHLYFY